MSGFEGAPVDTVVFDLGGVLVDWNPRYLYRKLFAEDEAGMERFLAEVCNGHWNEQQDAGRPFAEAVALLVARHPELRELIEAYDHRWPEMLGGPIDGTVSVLSELKAAGHPLYALTNWSAEKFPVARERYDFLGWFRGILVSGEERLKKPDPAIFRLMAARYGLTPERTVYIDDAPHNVAAAEALGFRALRFTAPERLRLDLAAFGLIS
jgi:2-haloacid dehalogenase